MVKEYELDNEQFNNIDSNLDDILLNQTNATQKSMIVDSNGNIVNSTRNSLDVALQDQITTSIDLFFKEVLNTVTLATPIVLDSNTCTFVPGP